jgi:hypothetical protein
VVRKAVTSRSTCPAKRFSRDPRSYYWREDQMATATLGSKRGSLLVCRLEVGPYWGRKQVCLDYRQPF